jgi:hypothetical protein
MHRLWTWLSCLDIPHSHLSSSETLEAPSSASFHCKTILALNGNNL